jgi:hypothetical protein
MGGLGQKLLESHGLSTNYQPRQVTHATKWGVVLYHPTYRWCNTCTLDVARQSFAATCVGCWALNSSSHADSTSSVWPTFLTRSHVCGVSVSREPCWYGFYNPLRLNVGACVVKWRNLVRHLAPDAWPSLHLIGRNSSVLHVLTALSSSPTCWLVSDILILPLMHWKKCPR